MVTTFDSVDGDTYIFLLGDSLEGWYQSRKEFLQLTGPTPLVPDFTFGGATALIPTGHCRCCLRHRCTAAPWLTLLPLLAALLSLVYLV